MATAVLKSTSSWTGVFRRAGFSTVEDRRLASLTWLVVLLGIAWRVGRYLAQFPIWGDEGHITLNFLDRDFWGMTKALEFGQVAPVLFLWGEWGMFQWLGPSELSLRLLPLLAGIGGLLLFWEFCRRLAPGLPTFLAVSLLAVSYYPVRHAVEVKPYSFDLFFSLALLVPAVRWRQEPGRLFWLVLLAGWTPIALAASYPAIFVAGGISLYLLPAAWQGNGKAKTWFVIYNLLMAGTFLTHMNLVGKAQVPVAGTMDRFLHDYWQDWFPPANPLAFPLWFLKAHAGNMLAYPVGGPNGASALTAILCLVGIGTFWKTRRPEILILLLAPFALSLAAALVGRYPYGGSARLAQHLAPAICLLMGLGIANLLNRLSSPTRLRGAVCLLSALGLLALGGLVFAFLRPYKTPGDYQIRRLTAELQQHLGPRETLVIFNQAYIFRPALAWYLRLMDRPLTLTPNLEGVSFDPHQQDLWGLQFHPDAGQLSSPDQLSAGGQDHWELMSQRRDAFAPDSKDVPTLHYQVLHWRRK